MKKYVFTDPMILEEQRRLRLFFQQKKFAPDTIKVYCNYMGYFLEYLRQTSSKTPIETRYEDLLPFIDHCRQAGKTNRNINLILTALRHYFKMLAVDPNPATGLYLRGEKQPLPDNLLDPAQLQQLYERYPVYNARTQRNKVITGLYVYQGVTTTELKRLEARHIDLKKGTVHIPATKRTRHKGGGKARILKLKADQILPLQEYLLLTRPKILDDLRNGKREKTATRKPEKIDWALLEQQLFISLNGSADIKPSIRFLMGDLRKIDGQVKDAVQLRQSVIVNWLKAHDIRQVQYMAGHGSISSTERYRAADLQELQEALKMHHPLG